MAGRSARNGGSSFDIVNQPDTDYLFTILSKRRRRLLLSALGSLEHSVPVEELVRILSENCGDDVGERDIRLLLTHSDLPMLDEADMVKYYEERGIVVSGTRLPVVTPFVEDCHISGSR